MMQMDLLVQQMDRLRKQLVHHFQRKNGLEKKEQMEQKWVPVGTDSVEEEVVVKQTDPVQEQQKDHELVQQKDRVLEQQKDQKLERQAEVGRKERQAAVEATENKWKQEEALKDFAVVVQGMELQGLLALMEQQAAVGATENMELHKVQEKSQKASAEGLEMLE